MRILTAASVAAVLLSAGLAGVAAAAPANPGVLAAATPTARVVVRPVTTLGTARAGFTVSREPRGLVDCSFPAASPGAVSANILECSPSAEYAIACWKSATPAHVLCMRNPRIHRLVKIPDTGTVAHVAALHSKAPLALTLRDGDHCSIRDGGAWGTLRSHPRWVGEYSCAHAGVVWAPRRAAHYGVNESTPFWTVRTAAASGTGPVVVRHVRRAYFVGTHTG